mgnify:CR=1 FL=1|jgi:hypothetical protein
MANYIQNSLFIYFIIDIKKDLNKIKKSHQKPENNENN